MRNNKTRASDNIPAEFCKTGAESNLNLNVNMGVMK